MNKKSSIKLLIPVLLVLLLAFISCEAGSEKDSSGSAGAAPQAVADLTSPPPGSQATQEKWDGFTEEKKQESWDKYLASLESGEESAPESTAEKSPAPSPSSAKPVSVITAPLSLGPMEISYYGLGEVEAGKVMRIIPAASGTAARVFVSEGDFVEPGDLLFSLDSSEWLKNIERTEEKWETELTLAQIHLEEAAKEKERTQTFFERDLATRQDLDKAEQALTEAQLNLEKLRLSRRTELEDLQENYAGRLGTSPGRGYVSQLSFTEGEGVNTSDFVEIVNLEEVLLTIEVPENIIPRIERDAPVKAKPPTAARYGMEGFVTGHNVLPENNRTYQVRAQLSNPNQRLLPGMLLEVQIRLTRLQPRFIVPLKSVITDGNDHYIYLVEDNTGKRVPVELGSGRQGMVQIEGSLKEGASIVIEGQSYLKPGSPVNVTATTDYRPEIAEL
jgi:membrane fusion protein (multidrug efflux system)